jgi:hypothetical protein
VDPAARTAVRQILRWLRDTAREDPLQLPILLRDVRDAGPHRVAVTLAHALRDPIEHKLPLVGVPALVTLTDLVLAFLRQRTWPKTARPAEPPWRPGMATFWHVPPATPRLPIGTSRWARCEAPAFPSTSSTERRMAWLAEPVKGMSSWSASRVVDRLGSVAAESGRTAVRRAAYGMCGVVAWLGGAVGSGPDGEQTERERQDVLN